MKRSGEFNEVNNGVKSKHVKISKHSLDSDEEDYQESDCFRLRAADIDGQENATLEYDDDIKITPFNMREELEEDGYFDGSGNFIFKKSTDARDNWLENIDWVAVNRQQNTKALIDASAGDENPVPSKSKSEKLDLYRQLFQLVGPQETVLRCIRRMGGNTDKSKSASASVRWSKKRSGAGEENQAGDPVGLIRATELADELLQAGEFDVYQMTHEDIGLTIRRNGDASPDDELEALGQALDEKDEVGNNDNIADNDTQNVGAHSLSVMWHLKRPGTDDEHLEGPYSSSQLHTWVQSGKFSEESGVLVRQVDKPEGRFYNIHRIDFELYV